MAQPTDYTRQADFSDHSTNFPTTPHVGTDIDAEFDAVKTTLDETLTNLAILQRDDTELANTTVGIAQLKAEVLALLGIIYPWVTATAYEEDDVVLTGNAIYRCLVDHTSGTFATDLAAAKWLLLLDFGDSVTTTTSTTSLAIGTGSKTFTVDSGKSFPVGSYILIVSDAAPTVDNMYGQVTSYSGTSLVVNVTATNGSGTHTDWTLYGNAGARGPAGSDGTVDLTTLTNLTPLDDQADELLIRDDSAGVNKAVTIGAFFTAINALTAETAVDSADAVALYDNSAGTGDKATIANLLKAITTLSSATATASDELLIADVDDSNNAKKITVQGILDLVSGAAAINTLTAKTSPAVADLLHIWDTASAAEKSMTFANFFKVINGLTADASPNTSTDYVVTYDADAGAAKKVLLSDAFASGSASTSTAGVVELATAAEVQTGTDTARVPSVSVMGSHQSAVKFWADVSQSAATPTLTDSYNVTSITDTALGWLTITIATDFASANWCCLVSIEGTTPSAAEPMTIVVYEGTKAAGSVQVMCYDTTPGVADPSAGWQVCGFGDQ